MGIKKQAPEIVLAMQLLAMERLENNVSENILSDKELILAMNSIDDVMEHFQWKKSKIMNDAIDRFIVPKLENVDNLDNINGSLIKWKEKWLEYYMHLSKKDYEKMCALEEQYGETGSCPELEGMVLPEEFFWTPIDYTIEEWQNMPNKE